LKKMAKPLTIVQFLRKMLVLSWALPQFGMGQIMTIDNQNVSVDMVVESGTLVLIQGDLDSKGSITNRGSIVLLGNLSNQLTFTNENSLVVDGDVNNIVNFQNTGTVELTGNWTDFGTLNTLQGIMILNGPGDQTMTIGRDFKLTSLIINGGGTKTLNDSTEVSEFLDLQLGILVPMAGLVVKDGGEVLGGSVDSFVDGVLYHEGGSNAKFYPVGKTSPSVTYAFAQLEGISGINPIVGVELVVPNPQDPIPGPDLIGINKERYWQLSVASGQFDSSVVTLETFPTDLDANNMGTQNTINVSVDKPVIAQADAPQGPFVTLGNEGNQDISAGSLTSEIGATQRVLAIALSPEIPPEGVLFIPNAFIPTSMDPDDNVFKIFGERVVSDNFSLRIFDSWGLKVYETDDFVEANTVGWNGKKDNSGAELPIGPYTYMLRVQFENGDVVEKVGAVNLLR